MHEKNLDNYYSGKRLGSFFEDGKTYFRLFAPRAERVTLIIFTKAENSSGKKYRMTRDRDGVWEAALPDDLPGAFYGFSLKQNKGDKDDEILCLDPYARAITTLNNYLNPRKAIMIKESNFDWEGDEWIQADWRDLIIYELHVRDMTAHRSSGAKNMGTYDALTEKNIKGGLNYLKHLGVNAVEIMPVQEFANVEIPFNKEFMGKKNTWNPYERNHWGYMTAGFFAPDSYYCDGGKELRWNKWTGKSGRQVDDLKNMVKTFHKNKIAVILDVVYNHYSEYECGGLKEIDREYYFRTDGNGGLASESFTGNDLYTERPMVRRMIVDSVLYWMTEYHIDGFRFDLGHLLDWQTVEEITRESQKINPDVILICEPWGNGYDPEGFSNRGWGSWNDRIRNGIKGENPFDGKGWLFQKWYGENNPDSVKNYLNGTLTGSRQGLFRIAEHAVNYLESHDGYTLGDFIRLATGKINKDTIVEDIDENARLSENEVKLNELAALFLFCSRGIVMIHAGQEFARSKIISSQSAVPDPDKGKSDHNSYNKDNETNHINYDHADLNGELVDYYRGLISLRKKFSAFRRAGRDELKFREIEGRPFAVVFEINREDDRFFVALNADHIDDLKARLPGGNWEILADGKKAFIKKTKVVRGEVIIPAISGIILRKV